MSENARWTTIIIVANLLINAAGLIFYNDMRTKAMARGARERAAITRKLDAAWFQRIALTQHLERTCRR